MRDVATSRSRRRRAATAVVAGALVLAACGGSDGSSSESNGGTTLPAPPDEVELDPAADVVANQLPDVVVDNITLGNKVNLRNVAPADAPILLWMWAPH
jgi:ABC-type glycerol-3-phosphate transport system substrate-binding protein